MDTAELDDAVPTVPDSPDPVESLAECLAQASLEPLPQPVDESKRSTSRRQRTKEKRIQASDPTSTVALSMLPHRSASLTLVQLRLMTAQLGYVPFNLVEVAAEGEDGHPLVGRLYPLNQNELSGRYGSSAKPYQAQEQGQEQGQEQIQEQIQEQMQEQGQGQSGGKASRPLPFPTTLWMACPSLHRRICSLEVEGWIQRLHARLNGPQSSQHLPAMQRAHQAYAAERWALLSEVDRLVVEGSGWGQSLRLQGVAGMRVFSGVKCLHCHYAHHLARPEHGNVIGQWVHELLLLQAQAQAQAQTQPPIGGTQE